MKADSNIDLERQTPMACPCRTSGNEQRVEALGRRLDDHPGQRSVDRKTLLDNAVSQIKTPEQTK